MKKLVAIVALAVILAGMIPLQADAHGVGAAAADPGGLAAGSLRARPLRALRRRREPALPVDLDS